MQICRRRFELCEVEQPPPRRNRTCRSAGNNSAYGGPFQKAVQLFRRGHLFRALLSYSHGVIVAQSFETSKPFIYGFKIVPKLTLFETVTPQTGANDGQDVCTLRSPTPPASSSQRNYADSSYTLPPLPPQICQSVPITGPVPCPNLVRPPQ